MVGVAMVEALRAGGSASGDADRSGSACGRAGGELEVRGVGVQEGARGTRSEFTTLSRGTLASSKVRHPPAFVHMPQKP